MRAFCCFAFALVCGSLFAQDIPEDQLVPGGEIVVDLQKLGNSWRTGKTVQMKVVLPSNYDKEKLHPVAIHLGGGKGDINGADILNKVFGGKDFICMGVDYSGNSYQNGVRNAAFAVTALAKVTKVDPQSIFLSGTSSGAYCITDELANQFGRAFSGFVVIIGGMEISPQQLGRRPLLLVAGEDDTQKASVGRARVAVQQSCHQQLVRARMDSTLIVQPKVGHSWKPDSYPKVKEWYYSRLPMMHQLKQLENSLTKAKTDAAKLKLYEKIAQCCLDVPIVTEAKEKVAAAKAGENKEDKTEDAAKSKSGEAAK